jgi:hypothetical protein
MPVGPVTFALDGACPASTWTDECIGHPGKICCVTAIATIDIVDMKCVAAPPDCADCSCLSADVCGTAEETVQVCSHVDAESVSCAFPR